MPALWTTHWKNTEHGKRQWDSQRCSGSIYSSIMYPSYIYCSVSSLSNPHAKIFKKSSDVTYGDTIALKWRWSVAREGRLWRGFESEVCYSSIPSRVKGAWYRTTVRTAAQDGFNTNSKLFKTKLVITPSLNNFKCFHEDKYIYNDILNPTA
jgi:hypothetical protein